MSNIIIWLPIIVIIIITIITRKKASSIITKIPFIKTISVVLGFGLGYFNDIIIPDKEPGTVYIIWWVVAAVVVITIVALESETDDNDVKPDEGSDPKPDAGPDGGS
ncbi:MAG: hypothetical protein ACJAYK_002105 [Crocinitomicaceae bacterium]|jgi:hypothetical protein